MTLCSSAYGQEVLWDKAIGGTQVDRMECVAATPDGGVICGGGSNSPISGNKTVDTKGGFDYYVVKLGALGNIEWQKSIGGDSSDFLQSIRVTSDGGYILGGMSSSPIGDDKTEPWYGDLDYWVIKLDALGNIEWQKTMGGMNTDRLFSIAQTTDGGYICAGWSSSDISATKSEICQGLADYWVVKLDAAGNIMWDNTIGGSGYDYLHDIVQTQDGGYILGGSSDSPISGDKTEFSLSGADDYWIIKLNAAGNIEWQNTIGGTNNEQLYAIAQGLNGDYMISGTSLSNVSGDKTVPLLGGQDIWVVTLDGTGNILWQKAFGGVSSDLAWSAMALDDGGYLIGSYTTTYGLSATKHEYNIGSSDYWIIKIDSIGNMIWQNTIGGAQLDYLMDIDFAYGSLFAGGSSTSGVSGDKTWQNIGNQDYWVLKLTGDYNTISGKAYNDRNLDGVENIGEPVLPMRQVHETETGRVAYTRTNGTYELLVPDTGSFFMWMNSEPYHNSVPFQNSASFSSLLQHDSLNDFAFQPVGVFSDLCVSITPAGPFRPGFQAGYFVTYTNTGTVDMNNVEVVFYPDTNTTFVTSVIPPWSSSPDSVVWNVDSLAPFQTGVIHITVSVSVNAVIGTLINSFAAVYPIAGDVNPACNISSFELLTTGSFDPNDIQVDRDTLFNNAFPTPPFLEYLIRFQNTGNDTAFTVKILNSIDTSRLEIRWLELMASSHPMQMDYLSFQRNMQFLFNDILLPDATTNELESHGFVRYRIKPKPVLFAGDIIGNNAAIYFDFNNPIITNTATTEIVVPTGVAETSGSPSVLLYPNPVRDEFTLAMNHDIKGEILIELTDISGRRIANLYSGDSRRLQSGVRFQTSDWLAGIYFLRISARDVNMTARMIKL